MGAKILGTGSYLPKDVRTNDDLAQIVETSDEWIVKRTGIRTRHILEPDQDPAEIGIAAGKEALAAAGASPDDVDLLIVSTNFPEMICPGSAPFIAVGLGMKQQPFFDLKAGCSGFVYALTVASGLIDAGIYQHILVIGAEAMSRVIDWTDRRTCVLFGDGAGATLLGPGSPGEGVLGISLHAVGEQAMLIHLPGGGTRIPASHATVDAREHFVKMEGSGVYRSAAPMMDTATREALAAAGLGLEDVDWLIPHQANIRIIESLVRRLEFDPDRVIINIDRVANTSSASIPIALDEALRDGRINRGDVVVLTAFGAGVTYGAAVVRI
ncbi:MAG TPA: ketoacyl-ACP synthase III [Candidatus Acetothermia bacterium]|nr:ketoacyl-ACP synthase III [Candidatus Bipolaricaulota bacterium]RLC84212.1 MAG: 3-oxoacyl-ACP synthase [Chloroflexota bacterium]RLE41317.1 MAG: 3-oxoacyl-ACP synthase [Candidatus Acetothermia bacterium]HDJ29970.1 ketoacyl-ACP synthase III [Candidatus Acetothermia bacterium]